MKNNKQNLSPEKEQEQASQEAHDTVHEEQEPKEPTLEEKYEQVCLELEAQKNETLRILAESENLKKRLLREKEDFCKFATSSIIENILPVMDNLELALQHGKDEPACKNLVQGVEMTMNIFRDAMKKHGLCIIGHDDIAKPFDPAVHEAMAQAPDESMDEGCVSQLLQPGYTLHDRLLRPAKVIVSSKPSSKDK